METPIMKARRDALNHLEREHEKGAKNRAAAARGEARGAASQSMAERDAMQHFVGTKIIKAAPMNRAEYNKYRGWQLPENENGADEGFLVEYLDGGAANHPDHAGYISWSPTNVFQKAYIEVGDVDHLLPHQQRVVAEKAELDDRLQKLLAFFDTETYAELDFDEKDRLSHQGVAMRDYSNILGERIAAFIPE